MMLSEHLAAFPDSFTLYLARHATPDWTRRDIPYHIPPGPPLTEQGLREAAQLGVFLNAEGVAHFLASPLERAWHTASIASEACGAPVEMNPDLAEWRPDETESGVAARMREAFDAGILLARAEAAPVALVSHGGPILALLKWLGLPADVIERYRQVFDHHNPLPTAGAWRVENCHGELDVRLVFAPEGVVIPTEISSS